MVQAHADQFFAAAVGVGAAGVAAVWLFSAGLSKGMDGIGTVPNWLKGQTLRNTLPTTLLSAHHRHCVPSGSESQRMTHGCHP